jgi:transketolase
MLESPENRFFCADDSESLALAARKWALRMTNEAKSSHIGSSLSVIDILSVLYTGVAEISPTNWTDPDRDVVILSKGHAAAGLYAVLGLQGFFSEEDLMNFCTDGSNYGGHITHHGKIGVELSTGSLGHGLPYGLGIALGLMRRKSSSKVYVVISDGECDEGTIWESALLAQQYELNNLFVIIDRNGLQSLTSTELTVALEPLADKWAAFNWNVVTVDGHSHNELRRVLIKSDKPNCIIANTIKGKGVSFMENSILWHYRPPSLQELALALSELEGD